MSIVGLALNVLCGCFAGPLALPFSIVGLVMANTESTAIAAGRRDPAGDGNARAAYVIGIIGLVIGALVLMLWIFVFGVGIWGALGSSTNS